MDHLLQAMHRLPQASPLSIDCGIVHQQLILAIAQAQENRRNVGLRAAILVEVIVDASPEGNDPQELAAREGLAVLLRIQLFDRTAEFRQIGADAGIAVDRLDGSVEEAVRCPGRLGNLLAAHRSQLIDLLAEFRAVGIERRELVDEFGDLLVEFADFLILEGNEARRFLHRDRLQRFGRLQLDLGRGGGRRSRIRLGFAGHVQSFSSRLRRGWNARPSRARAYTFIIGVRREASSGTRRIMVREWSTIPRNRSLTLTGLGTAQSIPDRWGKYYAQAVQEALE